MSIKKILAFIVVVIGFGGGGYFLLEKPSLELHGGKIRQPTATPESASGNGVLKYYIPIYNDDTKNLTISCVDQDAMTCSETMTIASGKRIIYPITFYDTTAGNKGGVTLQFSSSNVVYYSLRIKGGEASQNGTKGYWLNQNANYAFFIESETSNIYDWCKKNGDVSNSGNSMIIVGSNTTQSPACNVSSSSLDTTNFMIKNSSGIKATVSFALTNSDTQDVWVACENTVSGPDLISSIDIINNGILYCSLFHKPNDSGSVKITAVCGSGDQDCSMGSVDLDTEGSATTAYPFSYKNNQVIINNYCVNPYNC